MGSRWASLLRRVRDSAALLDATDGEDLGAPYASPPKAGAFLDEVGRSPGRLRIGFSAASPTGSSVERACVAAVEDAARLCEALGHDVIEAAPNFEAAEMIESMKTLLEVHLAFGIQDIAAVMGRVPSPAIVERSHWQLAQAGHRTSAVQFVSALEALGRVARQAARFWQDYDIWLTPTLARAPLLHGTIYANDDDAERYLNDYFDFVPFTPIANVTGNPAMTVPLWWDAGLPIGAHFVGRFGDEATLFRLAGQLEEARPWRMQIPPVSAWRLH